MTKLRWVLCLLCLTGCGAEPIKPTAVPIERTADRTHVAVEVIWADSRDEVRQQLARFEGVAVDEVPPQAVAFVEMTSDGSACRVHVLRPQHVDDDRTMSLGHEVLHCFWDAYHEPGLATAPADYE